MAGTSIDMSKVKQLLQFPGDPMISYFNQNPRKTKESHISATL